MKKLALLSLASLLFTSGGACAAEKVKVFVLAGQSNMVGHSQMWLLDSQKDDERFKSFWAPYRSNGNWTARKDVFTYFETKGKTLSGPHSVGFGYGGDKIGPELAFGHAVGDHIEEPVLLIKAAWGGHSLYQNFRPPSAGLPGDEVLAAQLKSRQKKKPAFTMEELKGGYGQSFRNMVSTVEKVISQKDSLYPSLKGMEVEIAGFFWFQGFNDQFGDHAPKEYQANMEHFIKDVRTAFKQPKLPFVIGAMGYFAQRWIEPKVEKAAGVVNGQLAMNNVPEFKGNVMAFKTAPLYDKEAADFFHKKNKDMNEWRKLGSDRPYHYYGSGIWYSRIGKKAGEEMIKLLK